MASNIPGPCCFQGFKHEGSPAGQIKTIGNVRTYLSYPTNDAKPEKAVLLFSDVFGIFNNSQLLADDFASNGYLAILPDLFDGDQMDIDDFDHGRIDIPAWLAKHGPEHIEPIVSTIFQHLTELGIKKIHGAGYCFGGKYVTRFLKPGQLDSGYTAHPSFVTDEELGTIQKPLSIAAARRSTRPPPPPPPPPPRPQHDQLVHAEIDQIFTTELRHRSEEILSKSSQDYQINLFSGVTHGFAIRADLSVAQNKFAKEQAFLQALAWFDRFSS